MIYIIDHQDSFTHNVVHQFENFDEVFCTNFNKINKKKLKEPFTAKNFEITMRCDISNTAMTIENNKEKIYGFQFHPESFLTENGNLLIKKILSA